MQITIKFLEWANKPDFIGDTSNLQGADLYGANLRGANLYGANLRGADLYDADLQGANLQGVKNAELSMARTLIVPEYGTFTGWKKCENDILVQVEIPAGAERSNASGRKCRASHVKVLKIEGGHKSAISRFDSKTTYKVGKIVRCDKWCDDRWQECAGGIHFFLTRIEAENY